LSSKKQVSLCIEDNGPGIPEDVIPQIFDPFFTTKEVGKGTGLGLSVIYGFINELGGDIEVQSDDTTRFDISFPIAEH
jgi:two-component system NtrC family sensor kinase